MTALRAFIVRAPARWVDGRRVTPGQRLLLTPEQAAREPVDPAPPDAPPALPAAPEAAPDTAAAAPRKPRRTRRAAP